MHAIFRSVTQDMELRRQLLFLYHQPLTYRARFPIPLEFLLAKFVKNLRMNACHLPICNARYGTAPPTTFPIPPATDVSCSIPNPAGISSRQVCKKSPNECMPSCTDFIASYPTACSTGTCLPLKSVAVFGNSGVR